MDFRVFLVRALRLTLLNTYKLKGIMSTLCTSFHTARMTKGKRYADAKGSRCARRRYWATTSAPSLAAQFAAPLAP
ncbi:hypothetical protein ABB37_01845 [Leptomonas pyrrhocoris]|uniref:Uncharacterized protein n=1 Tax=Leptomonas pyrrhocoris TaxID=157538 RepID=A0A0N0DZR3_LEPPY|nr:hypothetical protein ABB37_01845 [Leptomonas pyrrhocoris]KPA85585.1 hypothetical protein ABB37_01845 [Leptomonas pyrrhocoris]|eukprot:XP_015664024.1 hypothetical protein ABB37_01845 [Leptomonas pyrrhocoris]